MIFKAKFNVNAFSGRTKFGFSTLSKLQFDHLTKTNLSFNYIEFSSEFIHSVFIYGCINGCIHMKIHRFYVPIMHL